MTTIASGQANRLQNRLSELARYNSSKELEASDVYQEVRAEIEQLLNNIVSGGKNTSTPGRSVEAVAWNIERGIQLSGIIETMQHHPELKACDVLMLSEVDYGMARTQNRF